MRTERAYKQKEINFVEIVGERMFKNPASDPHYKTFSRKMSFPGEQGRARSVFSILREAIASQRALEDSASAAMRSANCPIS
jgi:hypothetical protein